MNGVKSMNNTTNLIGENIRCLRKARALTQEQFAEELNVSRQAVAKWESGETVPDIYNCIAIGGFFCIPIDDLVKGRAESDLGKGKFLFGTVTVGERGQIVIPKKAREVFKINKGDIILVLGDEQQGMALVKMKHFSAITNALMGEKEE